MFQKHWDGVEDMKDKLMKKQAYEILNSYRTVKEAYKYSSYSHANHKHINQLIGSRIGTLGAGIATFVGAAESPNFETAVPITLLGAGLGVPLGSFSGGMLGDLVDRGVPGNIRHELGKGAGSIINKLKDGVSKMRQVLHR